MNPGLVVKLRPAGPWRIGPDSGARNRVDVIYHSDSLYSAVTSAMSRMGTLDAWLDATARSQTPDVCFSSCFPFLDDLAFVVPPRTIWPPTTPAAMSARVRWKSARFIPLTMVESILEGRKLNDNVWSVDGASGCLVPVGKPGPFRTSVRWNAAVDRLSGASERHSTACIEFREGCGLWTVVGFHDDAARDQWQDPVKAAFRLLADTGFGGERSRGWGRAETPEFVEGTLPGLVIEYRPRVAAPEPESEEVPVMAAPKPPKKKLTPAQAAVAAEVAGALEAALAAEAAAAKPAAPPDEPEAPAPVEEAALEQTPEVGPEVAVEQAVSPATPDVQPESAPEVEAEAPAPEADTVAPPVEAAPAAEPAGESEGAATEPDAPAPVEQAVTQEATPEVEAATPEETAVGAEGESASPTPESAVDAIPEADANAAESIAETASPEPEAPAPVEEAAPPAEPEAPATAAQRAPDLSQPMRVVPEPAAPTVPMQAHWLLSLFTPATADAVDWGRGSYTVLARGGRIDSPSLGSGELKKQIQMVAEGSVLYSDGVPLGAAADVAPDGFAHPVFRAGFALAIPLPEVH